MNVKLLVVHGRPQGSSLLFPHGEFVFGRGAECHIRPNSDWVSQQHCLLRVGEDTVSIRDLGSRNGTLVNGELVVGERRLDPGDQLQIGPLVFELRLEESAPASPKPAESVLDTARHMVDTTPHIALEEEKTRKSRLTRSPEKSG